MTINYNNITIKCSDKHDEDTYYTYSVSIYADNIMVGTMSCMSNTADFDDCDSEDYVERIDVEAEYRNHGCGSKALKLLAEIVGGFDIAPDSEDSRRLYERLGDISHTDQSKYLDQGFGVYYIS